VGIAPVFPSGIVNLDKDEQPHSEQYQQSEKDIEICHLFISAPAKSLRRFYAFL
jgi:hypothetical protein